MTNIIIIKLKLYIYTQIHNYKLIFLNSQKQEKKKIFKFQHINEGEKTY